MKKIVAFFLFLTVAPASAAQDKQWIRKAGIIITHFRNRLSRR